jgi:CubicO group peptidase (beta-lactamase class C family)
LASGEGAFERVRSALGAASGKEFTGAVARIEHRGVAVFEEAYGVTRTDAPARPVYVDTRFDLASITKLFTTTLILQAVASGDVSLDGSLTRWFPEWSGTPHEPISLRMLLAHCAGINSGADFRQLLGFNIERYSIERELVGIPGERVVYSDLGFIVLGSLLQRVRNQSPSALATRTFARPTLGFRPALRDRAAIPATEDDGWRGRVQGFVHDEKAYLMGGVAGHAGLFGAAADVAWLTETYLGALNDRTQTVLPLSIVAESVVEQAADPVLRRGLGWALKTTDQNSCGRFFSASSFGHTGFVGTCVWADPERDLQGVLLTNSVYFGRKDTRDLRASFYDAAVEDLGLQ